MVMNRDIVQAKKKRANQDFMPMMCMQSGIQERSRKQNTGAHRRSLSCSGIGVFLSLLETDVTN